MKVTDENIKELYKDLKKYYGSITEIAKRTGKTPYWIGKMLTGKARMDLQIIDVAVDVRNEFKQKDQDLEQKILNKMNQGNVA